MFNEWVGAILLMPFFSVLHLGTFNAWDQLQEIPCLLVEQWMHGSAYFKICFASSWYGTLGQPWHFVWISWTTWTWPAQLHGAAFLHSHWILECRDINNMANSSMIEYNKMCGPSNYLNVGVSNTNLWMILTKFKNIL